MKTVRTMITISLLFLTAFLLVSCSTINVPVPGGFAVIRKPDWRGGENFTALSPEGIRYSVRTVENYPPKDLSFWKEALAGHLRKNGYQQVGESTTFVSSGKDGAAFEWGLPYGEENYIFMTAIIVYPRKIIVAEAGGEASLFAAYRESLAKSVQGITLR